MKVMKKKGVNFG